MPTERHYSLHEHAAGLAQQDGNVYTAAVDSGGAQKFTPIPGANPQYLLGNQVNPGWGPN